MISLSDREIRGLYLVGVSIDIIITESVIRSRFCCIVVVSYASAREQRSVKMWARPDVWI